jgi:hypothetical protein
VGGPGILAPAPAAAVQRACSSSIATSCYSSACM